MLLNILLVPHFIPTSTPILPDPPRQEVVLFVGYPCLGKSTIYRRHFQPVGYTHINQDTLKTRDKCVKVLKEALQAGQSCTIGKDLLFLYLLFSLFTSLEDNTNRNAMTRKFYVDVCKDAKVPIR